MIRKSIRIRPFLILVLWSLSFPLSADEELNKVQKLRILNMMKGEDYSGALRLISDLQKKDTASAELFFLGGECYLRLGNNADAISQLEKSVRLNSKEDNRKFFLLGRAYQLEGNLQRALINYKEFLDEINTNKSEKSDAEVYFKQCQQAIEMINNPTQVIITNLGDSINSEYPEYNPSLSADGKTLIFTSRRPDGLGSKEDPNDGKFFEDVFISQIDSASGRWRKCKLIEGKINTDGHDANMSLSPDGNKIFVYKNDGARGSGEIYVSNKGRTGKWSEPSKLQGKINSSYFESSACLTPDGKTLFFVSERPKDAFGMADIYVARKKSKNEWEKPLNIGPPINDEFDQIGVFIHPDGKTLYFSSNNTESIGGFDIFKSTLVNGKWTKPENLGYPINTPNDERFFQLSTDGRTALFSSNRKGGKGDYDIWEADMTKLKSKKEENTGPSSAIPISIFKGKIIDQSATPIPDAEITITNRDNGIASKINSDENGQYFITVEGEHNYAVSVSREGYKVITLDIFIGLAEKGTNTVEKIISLEKK